MKKACSLLTVSVLLLILTPVFFGQGPSNSISGRVTGAEGRPMVDLYVELLDNFSRTIGRTKTRAAGFYGFSGLSSGRFVVRVLTNGTDYEEQEIMVQIDSLSPGMITDEQIDFHLKLKKLAAPAAPSFVFVQDVPAEAKSAYDRALSDLAGGQTDTGVEGLKRAVEIFPRYYLALERLGLEYIRKDDVLANQAAEILFSAATEVNPRGYTSWFGLAYSLYKLREYSGGLTAISKAVELQPTSLDALILSGSLLRHSNRYAEAEKQLLKAQANSSRSLPQIHWELALLYGNHMKRYRDAARQLQLFLAMNPQAKDADNIKKLIAEFESKAKGK